MIKIITLFMAMLIALPAFAGFSISKVSSIGKGTKLIPQKELTFLAGDRVNRFYHFEDGVVLDDNTFYANGYPKSNVHCQLFLEALSEKDIIIDKGSELEVIGIDPSDGFTTLYLNINSEYYYSVTPPFMTCTDGVSGENAPNTPYSAFVKSVGNNMLLKFKDANFLAKINKDSMLMFLEDIVVPSGEKYIAFVNNGIKNFVPTVTASDWWRYLTLIDSDKPFCLINLKEAKAEKRILRESKTATITKVDQSSTKYRHVTKLILDHPGIESIDCYAGELLPPLSFDESATVFGNFIEIEESEYSDL